jgi:hypothetical protein
MQGRKKPRPPFGWDEANPAPRIRSRARREKFGGAAVELAAPAPALKFLQPLDNAERAARKHMGGCLAKPAKAVKAAG